MSVMCEYGVWLICQVWLSVDAIYIIGSRFWLTLHVGIDLELAESH